MNKNFSISRFSFAALSAIAIVAAQPSQAQDILNASERIFENRQISHFDILATDSFHKENVFAGLPIIDTNAVPTTAEENRFAQIVHYEAKFGRSFAVDRERHVIFATQSVKGSGGYSVSFGLYDGQPPTTLRNSKLDGLSIAGLHVGSGVGALLMRFGVPSDRFHPSLTGIKGYRSDYSEADGFYRYIGPVPNKAQSCRRSFVITVRHRTIVGMSELATC